MNKTILRKYARLIAAVGANVQKGQEVFITAGLDQPEFVAMVVEACYRCGAARVVVDWEYQPLEKLHVRHQSLRTLSELTDWQEARWKHYVDKLPCRIYLVSDDPDGLKGINQKKLATARQRRYPLIKGYRDQIENKYQWVHRRRARRGLGEEAVPPPHPPPGHRKAVGGDTLCQPRRRRPHGRLARA